MDDVRDLGGRLRHLLAATVLGIVVAFAISVVLPTRQHFGAGWCCICSTGWVVEGGDPVLIGAGAIVIANFAYIVLLWRAKRRILLPRARLVNKS